MKNKLPVRFTGQHFTINHKLIAEAINLANIGKLDTVLDIGAGKGYIASKLVNLCKLVLAIENDIRLIHILNKSLSSFTSVKIIHSDFMKYRIPRKPFKVVSNIPFNISSMTLKKLMYQNLDNFYGGTLIIPSTCANKLFRSRISNPDIIFYHTFYDIELVHDIHPSSFFPPPTITSSLIKIEKKPKSTIHHQKYLSFLRFMLKYPDKNTRTVLKKIFRKNQVGSFTMKYDISLDIPISFLHISQWDIIFNEMLNLVPERFHPT